VKKLVGRYFLEDRADYLEKLRELREAGLDPFRKRKALEKLKGGLDPIIDFEALLIPDSWERVSLVAPALAVEDIITNACDKRDIEKIQKTTGKTKLKTVTLLGPSTWSSPRGQGGLPQLVERGGKFVYCSVYVDGFYDGSKRPRTVEFVEAFHEAYGGAQPVLLNAIGFDSGGLLRQVLEKSAPRTREDMTSRLSALKDYDGATGTIRFDDNREAQRPLFLLGIDARGIKELPTPGAVDKPAG
jgi:branched-chain amino acid transport system substrate-binding protein